MLISTRGRYALRVLTDIAENQGDGFLPLKEVADRQGLSEKYLEAVIKVLVQADILTGVRGKGGGYRLSTDPGELLVLDVLRLTEESLAPVACLKDGAEPCGRESECRTIPLWRGLNQVISEYLSRYTIADLMKEGGAL